MYSYWQPTATWYACEIREWLNTEFYENSTNKAWAARPTKYAYAKGAYSAHGLSVKGLYEYEEDNTEYFLRTPGKETRLAPMVQPWLVVNEYGMNKTLTYVKRDGELIEVLGGVRPALWVDIAE